MPIIHEPLNLFNMKIKVSLLCIILFTAVTLKGQTADNCVTQVIMKGYSEKSYSIHPGN